MKIITKFLILCILIGSFLFPIIGVTADLQTSQTVNRFKIGLTGSPAEDWDIPITGAYGIVDLWLQPACTEYLFGTNDAYDRGLSQGVYKSETYIPILATDWVFDFWPEEMNDEGFVNRGGVANITYTLRDSVNFHDGSAWNATVAKWNIDRTYIITGNLTGNGDLRNRDTYWVDVNDWYDYFTPSWNMTHVNGTYGYYDGYFNSNPFGGFDGSGNPIFYSPYEMYPIVKRVVIVEDQAYGGKIRIEFNDFNTYSMSSVGNVKYISMEAYGDFWDRGIYGYDNDDPLYPDHMIGTGPYMYVDYDETGSPGGGTLAKNPNYWNRTALEDDGWFDADFIDIVVWPASTLGTESRNTALMTNAIDYALDNFFTPVDYQDVLSESRLNYIERPASPYVSAITLNCINESWYTWPGYVEWVEPSFPTGYPSGNVPSGLPRALRKAFSYAFDYDTYINVGLNGRAIRSSSLGVTNLYYNASIPIATRDLTIARNALLSDSYFGPLCDAQNLDENSTDTDWHNVANSIGGKTPIWVLDFYWDDQFQVMKNVFQTSLEDIGVSLKDETGATNKISTNMWAEVGTYWITGFPVFSAQAWPLDWNIPNKIPEGWIAAYYGDPNRGRWRPPDYDFPINHDWFPWFNLAFTYGTETDDWLARMWLSNDTTKQLWFNKIADWAQNDQYNWIFISQSKEGSVHWKDWEISNYWGSISYHLTKYVGFAEEFPEIPGFLTFFILSTSVITMMGLIYVVRRKSRFE